MKKLNIAAITLGVLACSAWVAAQQVPRAPSLNDRVALLENKVARLDRENTDLKKKLATHTTQYAKDQEGYKKLEQSVYYLLTVASEYKKHGHDLDSIHSIKLKEHPGVRLLAGGQPNVAPHTRRAREVEY